MSTTGGAIAAVLAASTLGLISCSTTTAGTPAPTDSPVAGSATSPTNPASSSTSPSDALTTLNACNLLTNEEAAQFKPIAPGHLNTTGSSGAASDCDWTGRSANDSSMAFGVLVRPTEGVKDINTQGGKLTNGDVNGRPAGQFTSNIGGKCLIAIGVSPTARVDVSAVIGGAPDPTEACQVADTIASHVEPRLPKYTG